MVRKAGDVIPEVIGPVIEPGRRRKRRWKFPEHCPVCGAPLVRLPGEADTFCTNLDCAGQRVQRIAHFASRSAMDIEGLGELRVQLFVDRGLLNDVADLYSFTEATFDGLEGFAAISIANLLGAIDASRGRPLSRLLIGLGIRHLGEVGLDRSARGRWATSMRSSPQTSRLSPRSREWARSSRRVWCAGSPRTSTARSSIGCGLQASTWPNRARADAGRGDRTRADPRRQVGRRHRHDRADEPRGGRRRDHRAGREVAGQRLEEDVRCGSRGVARRRQGHQGRGAGHPDDRRASGLLLCSRRDRSALDSPSNQARPLFAGVTPRAEFGGPATQRGAAAATVSRADTQIWGSSLLTWEVPPDNLDLGHPSGYGCACQRRGCAFGRGIWVDVSFFFCLSVREGRFM